MTERDANLCNHCLLPVGLRAQRTVNGGDCSFCCYGCCIAFQAKHSTRSGRGLVADQARSWCLLTMNIMLISLLLYAGRSAPIPG